MHQCDTMWYWLLHGTRLSWRLSMVFGVLENLLQTSCQKQNRDSKDTHKHFRNLVDSATVTLSDAAWKMMLIDHHASATPIRRLMVMWTRPLGAIDHLE